MTTEQTEAKPALKKILILDEKHGKSYYDASTNEVLYKALLSILRVRMDTGYYYEPKEPSLGYYEEYLNIPADVVKTLPDAMKELIAKAEKSVKQIRDEYAVAREWYDCAVHILSLPEEKAIRYVHVEDWFNPRTNKPAQIRHHAIIWLFQERADHQYEGWEIVTLDTP